MNVQLVSFTAPFSGPADTAEDLIVYCARVSSPKQDAEKPERLLGYLVKHGHWSPFEMVSMTLEIETSRAISAQILRHRSFSFQEFSQRYSEAPGKFEYTDARRQSEKNRQGSTDDVTAAQRRLWEWLQVRVAGDTQGYYQEALDAGIAREQARMLLPLGTTTRLYMHGTARSWIHYFQARCTPETQKEHRDIAQAAQLIFVDQFPLTSAALGWITPDEE